MEISDFLFNRLAPVLRERDRVLVGICGRAGAGKSTLTQHVAKDLKARGIPTLLYSGDWRFYLDSADRKAWMEEKWKLGMDAYIYALNQFSWWNFSRIYQELDALMQGRAVDIAEAYDRRTGKKNHAVRLPALERGCILFENSILGGAEHLQRLDQVVLVNTEDEVCFRRILDKDAGRRSFSEIVQRHLVTTFGENFFLKMLLEKFADRTVACSSEGRLGPLPKIHDPSHIPVPYMKSAWREAKKGTVFVDLDGTLVKHVEVPSETGEEIKLLPGSVEKLKEFQERGLMIVLTTSRPQHKIIHVAAKLRAAGLVFDQIISDLPLGPRHLINDSKDSEVRAYAYPLKRDAGIGALELQG